MAKTYNDQFSCFVKCYFQSHQKTILAHLKWFITYPFVLTVFTVHNVIWQYLFNSSQRNNINVDIKLSVFAWYNFFKRQIGKYSPSLLSRTKHSKHRENFSILILIFNFTVVNCAQVKVEEESNSCGNLHLRALHYLTHMTVSVEWVNKRNNFSSGKYRPRNRKAPWSYSSRSNSFAIILIWCFVRSRLEFSNMSKSWTYLNFVYDANALWNVFLI